MLGGSITLLVWSAIFLFMSIVTFVFACKFLMAARRSKKDAEDFVKAIEIRTRKEYNKIATLGVREMHDFLITVFSKSLELVSYKDISKIDPDGTVTLYTLATNEFLEQLGPTTISAIEYYYGEGYLTRWTLMSYKLLEKRGVITGVIDHKETQSNTIARALGVKGEG